MSAGLLPSRDSGGRSGPCLFQPLEAADLPRLLVTSLQPLLPPSGILPVHDNQASFLLLFFSHSSCLTLWEPTNVSFSISQSLLKLTSPESVMPPNHLILCCPFLCLPSIFPSIRIFSNESAFHIRWPKSWNFSISPSNEYSSLIFFRIS